LSFWRPWQSGSPLRPRSAAPRLEQLEDRVTPSAPDIIDLAAFGGGSGQPLGGMVADKNGTLYGEFSGYPLSSGYVFLVTKGSGTITTMASIPLNDGGPVGGLVMDGSGNLYGTTAGEGLSGGGIVFELTKGSSTITTLASLNVNSNSRLVIDSSGNLYGTTAQAGLSAGTIFELAKGSGKITTLATFGGSPNGVESVGGLVMDDSGNLFGTAVNGAVPGGTIFEVAKGSGKITTLASIPGNQGSLVGGLVLDSSGNLYGTTTDVVFGGGTVFELAKGSSTITTLGAIGSSSGSSPTGGLVLDGSGNLFGTTASGNGSNDGTIFELAQGSGTITTLASFNGSNGQNPTGYPLMDSSGNLYGTTAGGGLGIGMVVYELPSGAAVSGSTGNGGSGGGAGHGGGASNGGQHGSGGAGNGGGGVVSGGQQGSSSFVVSLGGFAFPIILPAPGQSAGVIGMAEDEIELLLLDDLAFMYTAMGQPNPQINALVSLLSSAINNDPMPMPLGWLGCMLGVEAVQSVF
jgi:uncharacterized repeat protein (TIGR03803 family)